MKPGGIVFQTQKQIKTPNGKIMFINGLLRKKPFDLRFHSDRIRSGKNIFSTKILQNRSNDFPLDNDS
jgi:hypothetical protein